MNKQYIIFYEWLTHSMINDIITVIKKYSDNVIILENCAQVTNLNDEGKYTLNFWGIRYYLLE